MQLKDNMLIVKDSGMGINKKNISKIFERFYRDTNVVGGFGLGLHIVASICSEYNIKIDIDSKINEGTSFFTRF